VLVVLDSNIFFSALISPHGTPHAIFESWQKGRFEVATCRTQIDEIRRASRYPKLRAILKPHLVGKMLNSLQDSRMFDNVRKRRTALDPDDAYLLDLAELSKANYLVTGDKRSGLLATRKIGEAKILTAAAFYSRVLK
jgi:putative PIN family toxin of toxin-antitoxin system